MRRINIRKRKRLLFKEINQKALKLIALLIVLLIICLITFTFSIQNIIIKNNFEKDNIKLSNLNENIPFCINKIILFSSATAKTDSVNQSLSLDISQYCDIGIYLNNTDKQNSLIKSLFINNINISPTELGTPCLYKKRVTDLGKCSFSNDTIIKDDFYFNIIDSNMKINYNNYELLNDGTTPISLGFYNKDIKKEFLIDNKEILYNGSLLKEATIPQSSLKCNISFNINIITISDEQYVCNMNIEIPFEDDNSSIYNDGYITKEINSTQINRFIRLK